MRSPCRFHKRGPGTLALSLLACTLGWAQAPLVLTLDRGSAALSGTVTFNMNMASRPDSLPAGLQWTLSYAPGDVAGLSIVAGPALLAGGKTLNCNTTAGSTTCLAWARNTSAIANGRVAVIIASLSPGFTGSTLPITLSNTLGVLPEGYADTALASADTVTLPGDGSTAINLALGKPTSQSSTYPLTAAVSALAVDGNTDGNYYNGSVTSTNLDPNAWWQVDLGASSSIQSVVLWNRTDCCSSRLSDFWVFVSETPFLASDTAATLQNRPGVWSSYQSGADAPFIAIPAAVQGRYVRVQLAGNGELLSLAEVRVMGAPPGFTNLSQGKSATQSSTLSGYTTPGAYSAVDGVVDGNFFNGSVTSTDLDNNPWWQVDLGVSSTIRAVEIWNRTDCCGARLSDYWVFVSDTPFLPGDTPATLQNRSGIFNSRQTTVPAPSTSLPFGGASGIPGRYVRVQLPGSGYLSLAEVKVRGSSPANVSQGRPATQSSTLPGDLTADAFAAVDGNTDGSFFHNSVSHTNLEVNPWWQVDLGASTAISSISLWNRTDCCGSRLSDYWVFVSDTPFLTTDTPANLRNRAGTFNLHQTTAPPPVVNLPVGAQGRYVRVQLNGTDYLSLAEVQVFAQ